MKIYELKDISYSYFKGKVALDNINLEISAGEKVAVIGPNGCGKTTLLSILDGLLFPNFGEIKAFGEILNETKLENPEFNINFRKKTGYVFQNPDVMLFCPTVLDELSFGPLQLNIDNNELKKRLEQMIELFHLEKLLKAAPFSLSFGEKKRVALASVIINNPEVILLDEPTTGLDPKNKNILINLINKLNQNGKTIITATHDYNVISEISTRVEIFGEENTIIKSLSHANVSNNPEILCSAGLL